MGSGSFWIDLHEVEAAARKIESIVRELESAAERVETAVQRIPRAAYGTGELGKALLGGGSGASGLVEHQQQALQGIHRYLRNSAAMAENLMLMCRRHRETDGASAAEFRNGAPS
ncbi:hypothetical protein ACFC1R_33335 [Kitasatospora sp. NPDC056138]|uniref:hypothetical protein n=1 Tax=Kitasatospora sp. NPDC056138 TaxID=3345724 RepID=UPI0035D6896C